MDIGHNQSSDGRAGQDENVEMGTVNQESRVNETVPSPVTGTEKEKEKRRWGFQFPSRKKSEDTGTGMEPEKSPENKFVKFVKKFWYIILIVVIVIAALIGWRIHEMNVDATWNKAIDYYGRADYKNAAKLIENMEIPKDEKRLTAYAQTMLATRQLDKALPAYKTLYEQKKDPSIKIIIGNIYNEQKKYDEAAKLYREIITANESYIQAYVNLSTLYKLQGKSQQAIEVAQQGVKANANSVVLHELLIAMLLEKQDSPEFKQAVETLRKINPQDPIFETLKNQ